MSNYKTELENAITSADNLICTMNAIGDAMDTGESAAADYVGAIRVLAEAAKSHARDLKAIHLCMTRYGKVQDAEDKNTRLRLTDELTHAENYLERVELLIGGIEEEYFNENANDPNTANGKEYIIAAFDENRIKTNIVRDYVTQVRDVLADMVGLIKRDTERNTPTQTYSIETLACASASLAFNGKPGMEQALALLAKYGVEKVNHLKPEQYGAFAADLRALGVCV